MVKATTAKARPVRAFCVAEPDRHRRTKFDWLRPHTPRHTCPKTATRNAHDETPAAGGQHMAKAKAAPAATDAPLSNRAVTPTVVMMPVAELTPYDRNPRVISEEAVAKVAASIKAFGFANPILISRDGVIIAGHTRLRAALSVGLDEVPTITLPLTERQARKYRLADNKTSEFTGWAYDLLRDELKELSDDGSLDLEDTGFSSEELSRLLQDDSAPTLDALEDAYGDHDEQDAWPTIEVKIPPDMMERWQSILDAAGDKGEADFIKIGRMLAAVNTAALRPS